MFPERKGRDELCDFSLNFESETDLIEQLCGCLDNQIMLWRDYGQAERCEINSNYINNTQYIIDSWNKTARDFLHKVYQSKKIQEENDGYEPTLQND